MNSPPSTWLVTGATGVVGPSIVDAIAESHGTVRVLTRRIEPPDGAWPWRSPNVDVRTGDVSDVTAVRAAMQGVDVVIHAAGIAHRRPGSEREVCALIEANVASSRTVALVAAESGVDRVMFLSSASVYGPGDGSLRDESVPTRPMTAYGRSKVEAERAMAEELGDVLTVLRSSAVYGPRFRGHYAYLARAVRSSWPIPIVDGHGHSLITDRDLARAVVGLATAAGAGGEIVNVSDGGIYTVGDVVAAIRSVADDSRGRGRVVPGSVGRVAGGALARLGGAEWTRRGRLRQATMSLTDGPALDTAALERLLPERCCDDLATGWARAAGFTP